MNKREDIFNRVKGDFMRLPRLVQNVPLIGDCPDVEIDGLVCHSKNVTENSMFVTWEENQVLCESYLMEAWESGAKVVVSPVVWRNPPETVTLLLSENPRKDFALLCGNWFGHPERELILIGVTGTNGKTSVTHFVKEMLEGLQDDIYRKVGLIGTNENKIGEESLPTQRTTPQAYELQSLLRMMVDAACTHVVMEVSSHGLVQSRCGEILFEVGVFTNLTHDHLDYHTSMDLYKNAKALLFQQCKKGVFSFDDPVGREYARCSPCQVISYGISYGESTLQGKDLKLYPHGVDFICQYQGSDYEVQLPVPAQFSCSNALACLGCGIALGLPMEEMIAGLSQLSGVKGRLEVVSTPFPFTVMIDYAHTPDALENLLRGLKPLTQQRLICLFGCGGNRDRSKREVMGEIAFQCSDVVIVTSDNPRWEDPELIIQDILSGIPSPEKKIPSEREKEVHVISNRKEGIALGLSLGKVGDIFVLAGKGHECYQEIKGEKLPFDERVVIASYSQKI